MSVAQLKIEVDASQARAFLDELRAESLASNATLRVLVRDRLVWLEEAGVGYFECEQAAPEAVYDQAYFDRYRAQADTLLGRRLMASRVELVKRHVGDLALSLRRTLDVGIGSGAFIEAMEAQGFACAGYDVNPAGVAWLQARGTYADLYAAGPFDVVTFWDALEHIREPTEALARCAGWVFVALPIFRDAAHVLASRHYRRDEHYWYFTRAGFRWFAEGQGFEVLDIVASETALGRDDVETFVLRRRP